MNPFFGSLRGQEKIAISWVPCFFPGHVTLDLGLVKTEGRRDLDSSRAKTPEK